MSDYKIEGRGGTRHAEISLTQITNVGHTHRRWSPLVAVILSFLLPGLGQLYKGQVLNGVLWFLLVGLGYVFFILPGVVLHLCCMLGAMLGDPYR